MVHSFQSLFISILVSFFVFAFSLQLSKIESYIFLPVQLPLHWYIFSFSPNVWLATTLFYAAFYFILYFHFIFTILPDNYYVQILILF